MTITRKEILQVLGIFVLWRVILFAIGYIAPWFLVYEPAFPYAYSRLPFYSLPQWIYSWANFDGLHYLTIAEGGYKGYGLIQAFFPTYPFLLRYLKPLFENFILSGLYISNISTAIFLCLFFSYIKNKFSVAVAWKSIFAFLLFPTSFFMVAVYNESLFLCFVILTFIFADKKRWFMAGISAALASATRIVGIFLVPALLIQLFFDTQQTEITKSYLLLKSRKFAQAIRVFAQAKINMFVKYKRTVFAICLGVVGLLGYMSYLWYEYGDPLYFLHVQAEFGGGRQESFVVLPQVLWRAVKVVITIPKNLRWLSYVQELVITCAVLATFLYGLKKRFKLPIGWTVFSILAILLPPLTGTLSSMPRYVLVAFPLFVILAQLKLKKLAWILLCGSMTGLLILNTILFIQGYWVA